MPDVDHFVQEAHLLKPLRDQVLRSAVQALRLPPGSRGLEAGRGTGLQALLPA